MLPAETRLTVYRRRPFGRSRYILLYACPVLLRSGLSLVSRSGDSAPGPKETEDRDSEAETAKQRQNIDQQECAPGGLSPTNIPVAKRLYFAIPGTKRIMQEGAPGDKGGAAIGFAKMRFAIFSLNHCKRYMKNSMN